MHAVSQAVTEKPQSHAHTQTYVKVAVILAVITAMEFGIVYIPGLKGVVLLTLALLSIGKFALVGAYFMHLKQDSSVYTKFFASGALLAALIAVSLKLLMQHKM